ncbi:MAG: HAD family phosphatase [Prevotella sp.]|nr:HAD family phosphatase [Prevotella sp.]MCM1074514.1 HAD family phosphatase [Ruminococcus sp.]
MLTKYTDIVFDLGGVVLDINRDLCVENLLALGLKDAADLLDLYCQSGDFLALEEGKMSAAAFYDKLRERAARPVTDVQLTEAIESFIVGLPIERLQALRQLKKRGKRLYVLSNTNSIMYHGIIDRLFRQEGLCIRDYFDGEVVSFQEKVCKPKAEIFEILKRRYSLNGEMTLFLDDSPANCEAAQANGIDAVCVEPGTEFIEVLK